MWSDVWSEVSPEAPHSSLRSPTWLKHIQVFGPGGTGVFKIEAGWFINQSIIRTTQRTKEHALKVSKNTPGIKDPKHTHKERFWMCPFLISGEKHSCYVERYLVSEIHENVSKSWIFIETRALMMCWLRCWWLHFSVTFKIYIISHSQPKASRKGNFKGMFSTFARKSDRASTNKPENIALGRTSGAILVMTNLIIVFVQSLLTHFRSIFFDPWESLAPRWLGPSLVRFSNWLKSVGWVGLGGD